MSTAETLAFWALIVSAATLLVYLGQLTVLILVYRRVIKETDRNAQERQQQLEKSGDMMQEMGKDMVRRMNKIAKRNTILFSIVGVCAAGMLFANRAIVRKFERNNTKKREK
jgi:fructose-1,6-bisphosphatase/sedoheptulose 1,7-bisphosphatase-like protein